MRSVTGATAMAMALTATTLALALAGCGSSSSQSAGLASGAPLKIGYLASLTGFCSTFSQEYVKGAELAVKEIDEQGGVLGHKLQLIVRDDKATPTVGVSQARDLVLGEHVKYLAGTCSSAVGKSVELLVANPSHVIYVAGVADPTIFTGGPQIYAFDTIPSATIEGSQRGGVRARAPPMEADCGARRGLQLRLPGNGRVQEGDARQRAERSSARTTLPSGGTDYTPYIDKLIAEHPDAVYSTVITEDTVTLVKQGLPAGVVRKDQVLRNPRLRHDRRHGSAAGRRAGLHVLPLGGDLPHAVLARARVAGQDRGQRRRGRRRVQPDPDHRAGDRQSEIDRPDAVREALGGRDGADGPGERGRSTSATTRSRCRSRWARSCGQAGHSRSRTFSR